MKKRKRGLWCLLTIFVMCVFFYPIFTAVITSLKTNQEISWSVTALPKAL